MGCVAKETPPMPDGEDGDTPPNDGLPRQEKSTESKTPTDGKSAEGFTQDQVKEIEQSRESFGFQAEVARLMDIIINSLYSNREIFIRELISNAADALDKIRFKSLTETDILGEKTNLDTVAKSGTTDFLEAAVKGGDPLNLIGQFGVGFYSVFLAADKVTVVSKHNDDPKQHIWESKATSEFTVSEDPRGNTLGRGTSIILHMKEDAEEFLNEDELEKIVTRYSQFVNFPIHLMVSETVGVPPAEESPPPPPTPTKEGESGDDLEVGEEEDDEPSKPAEKSEPKTVQKWKRLNDVKAIWTRNPSEVTTEEYDAFYQSLVSKNPDSGLKTEGYLDKTHFIAEGEITFRTILYVPKQAPIGLYDSVHDKSKNLRLYVRKVLIAD